MSRSTSSSLLFVCRSCRNAIRQPQAVTPRQFSSTRCLEKRALPAFQESSSPELSELLSTIRSKLFLPHYLNRQQRKLIQSQKSKSQLEYEPVFATLGDEDVRLEHLDVTKDVPRSTSFLRVLDLSTEPRDWRNIPGLLEGFHTAKGNLKHGWLEKLIRKANENGMLSVVIQCLWQVERNGFTLGIPIVRERILLEIRHNAAKEEWAEEVTQKSLKQVQNVLELMEKPEHCGSRTVTDKDPRAEPYVVGVPLELAAARAKNHLGGKDEDGLVAIYAKRLVAALGQQQHQLSDDKAWEAPKGDSSDGIRQLDWLVRKYLPARNGLKLAQDVLGSSLSDAQQHQLWIEERLDQAISSANQLADADGIPAWALGLHEWQEAKQD